jgi:hypothetical protein
MGAGDGAAALDLTAWPEVLPPHPDLVISGPVADFAADLHGAGDPIEFFRRTHLTRGLRELLPAAVRRLGGDRDAPAVLSLESGFGAGKTHTLVALWQLASGTPLGDLPADLQELLAGATTPDPGLPGGVRRAALVGTQLPATGSVTPDGIAVGTAWGELAWQLGGATGFAMVAEADAGRTSPAGRLRELLAGHAPCLVLLDEWVAYARQLLGRDDLPAGTFDTQLSFVQALTEAACAVSGALVVVTLPVGQPNELHDHEKPLARDHVIRGDHVIRSGGRGPSDGGDEEEASRRLRAVVRRVAEPWRPPGRDDTVAIVRRRLFAEPAPAAPARIAATAQAFADLYRRHAGGFPAEVAADPQRYARRIAETYPLHPELLDRLLTDWATLPGFQRTRGVLRVVATVVRTLLTTDDRAPLILPGTLPLDHSPVVGELLRVLPEDWQPVLDADVEGPASPAVTLATTARRTGGHPGAIARRAARAVFLGTAPGAGLDLPRIRLGAALPGDVVAEFATIVDQLARRSRHLHTDGERYRYDLAPSLAHVVAERVHVLRGHPDQLWAEVVARLRAAHPSPPPGFAAVQIAPDTSTDIPDGDDLRLVLIHPAIPHDPGHDPGNVAVDGASPAVRFAMDAVRHRGGDQRVRRNRLVFLAADLRAGQEVAETAADFLAWDEVNRRGAAAAHLTGEAGSAASRRRRADDALTARIRQAYLWVVVPEQPDPLTPPRPAVERLSGGAGRPADRVAAQLRRAGLLAGTVTQARIRADLDGPLARIWQEGHVSVGAVWEHYARHAYLARLPDRATLVDAVAAVLGSPEWRSDGFALAQGYDPELGRYRGLVLPGPGARFGEIGDRTLLVRPDVALRQVGAVDGGGAPSGPTAPPTGHPGLPSATPQVMRQFRGTYLAGPGGADPVRAPHDLAGIGREIVRLLASSDGVELEVTVQVRAVCGAGFPKTTMRAVQENARSLRLSAAVFTGGDEDDRAGDDRAGDDKPPRRP